MVTALPYSNDAVSNAEHFDLLSSSRDDIITSGDQMSSATAENNFREKRFFINKNQFVVSSVVTTFAFVNTTVTRTVNVLTPTPTAQCVDTAGSTSPCGCLPPGFIVCPPATG
jgi:hypothetical protein